MVVIKRKMSRIDLKDRERYHRYPNPSKKLRRALTCTKKDFSSKSRPENSAPTNLNATFQSSTKNTDNIDNELCIWVQKLALTEPVSYMKFKIFQQTFDQIIQSYKKTRKLLSLVKAVYDRFISSQINEIQELNLKINNLKERFHNKINNYKIKIKHFEDIEISNIQISKENALLKEKNRSLELKISKLTRNEQFFKKEFTENKNSPLEESGFLNPSPTGNSKLYSSESNLQLNSFMSSHCPLNELLKD